LFEDDEDSTPFLTTTSNRKVTLFDEEAELFSATKTSSSAASSTFIAEEPLNITSQTSTPLVLFQENSPPPTTTRFSKKSLFDNLDEDADFFSFVTPKAEPAPTTQISTESFETGNSKKISTQENSQNSLFGQLSAFESISTQLSLFARGPEFERYNRTLVSNL
jgi:hypothetical protein